MIITINDNTQPYEMHHIAVALQRIAAERGYEAPVALENITSVKVNPTPEQAEQLREVFKDGVRGELVAIPPVTQVVNEAGHVVGTVTLNDPATIERVVGTDDGVSVSYVVTPVADIEANHATVTNDNLDSAGLPWDARIHAGSRERNTDGSWRVRRKPKDTDQEEWNATLARVTSELRDLMEIPVTPGAVADAAAEDREIGQVHHTVHRLTDAEVDEFVDIVQGVTGEIDQYGELVSAPTGFVEPPVVVAPPVIAPPVVIPPVTAVAPPIATASPAIETFAQLMSWLTSRTPKEEAAKPAMVIRVNEILASNGLTTLQQLGQRAELIPQVLAQFREAFGE